MIIKLLTYYTFLSVWIDIKLLGYFKRYNTVWTDFGGVCHSLEAPKGHFWAKNSIEPYL